MVLYAKTSPECHRHGAAGCAHCVECQNIVCIDILVDQALHDFVNLQAGQRQVSLM